jgi:hypothetical protein
MGPKGIGRAIYGQQLRLLPSYGVAIHDRAAREEGSEVGPLLSLGPLL